jgi:hypothetical protein
MEDDNNILETGILPQYVLKWKTTPIFGAVNMASMF